MKDFLASMFDCQWVSSKKKERGPLNLINHHFVYSFVALMWVCPSFETHPFETLSVPTENTATPLGKTYAQKAKKRNFEPSETQNNENRCFTTT